MSVNVESDVVANVYTVLGPANKWYIEPLD